MVHFKEEIAFAGYLLVMLNYWVWLLKNFSSSVQMLYKMN